MPKIDKAIEDAVVTTTIDYEGKFEPEYYEIAQPNSLHSTLTTWINSPVYYRVYSRLPTEEVKKVVQSLINCDPRPK